MKRRGRARLTLRPGDPGTKRWVLDYGDQLVAVRYRYDEREHRRYTTVELVVDDRPWTPERHYSDPDRLVGLRIGLEESSLRRRVKQYGGRWDPAVRLWWLPLHLAAAAGLEERIAQWSDVPRGDERR